MSRLPLHYHSTIPTRNTPSRTRQRIHRQNARAATESLARSTWATPNAESTRLGMSFAENKTKTLHDRLEDWGIGTTVNKLRFLGYWLETPPPTNARTRPHLTTT